MKYPIVILFILLSISCLSVNWCKCISYISSKTVSDLSNFNGIIPNPRNCGPISCINYLSSVSCLGALGPIGAMGPLGTLGPVGDNVWNPSVLISGIGNWDIFSQQITGFGGPLSANGPLGSNGPLGYNSYSKTLPSINDFAAHLPAQGIWSVLGPIGPLGPLGLLGPLGPIGAHGYRRNSGGDFVDKNGRIVTSVTIPYNSTSERSYPLFEYYSSTHAKELSQQGLLDTSFMVEGDVVISTRIDEYSFTSNDYPQYISVVVTPGYSLDNFNLTLINDDTVITYSALTTFVNWIQVYVQEKTTFTVKVSLAYTAQFLTHPYRLFVVGSTSFIPISTQFKGSYIKSC